MNYLEEYYMLTLKLGDDKTKSFVNDLLLQNIENKMNFNYDDKVLSIDKIETIDDKLLKVILHKKNIVEKNEDRHYKKRENKFFNKYIIISVMMPQYMLKRYNLNIDERFETKKELCDRVGLTPQAIDNWLKNEWIKLEKKEHGNKGKTSSYQENRGYISDEGRNKISCARSKELNERLEGEIIVTEKLPEKLQKKYGIKPCDIFDNFDALMKKIDKSKKTVDNWRSEGWIEFVK